MLRILKILVVLIMGQSLVFAPLIHAAKPLIPIGDLDKPKIDHKIVSGTVQAGTAHQIKVIVTDNVGVKSVLLFYRTAGTKTYKRTQMARIEGTDTYSLTLAYDQVVEPGVEYYFQAIDNNGNSLLLGYSFSPLSLHVARDAAGFTTELAQTDTPTSEKTPSKAPNNWVWIGLGILALGVVAAVAGGGSDSGDDDSAGKPDEGAIEISGPAP